MQCKLMTTHPPSEPQHTPIRRPAGVMAPTTVQKGILGYYTCARGSNKTTSEKKKKKRWRPEMTSTGSAFTMFDCQSLLPRSSFTKSVHSKRSVYARALCFLLSVPVLIVTFAVRSFRAYPNTSGVREFEIVWNFPSLSH